MLCMSHSICHGLQKVPRAKLQDFPIAVLVRPIGISVLREVTGFQKYESLIDFEVSSAFKTSLEISRLNFGSGISNYNLNAYNLADIDMLLRITSGIKICISSSLHRVHQSLLVDPTRI